MVNFPVPRLDNLGRQMLQITLLPVYCLPPMQNLLGNISGVYLIAVAKVVTEDIPQVELWKQADCSKTYKLDKDYQDDNYQREMILQLVWPFRTQQKGIELNNQIFTIICVYGRQVVFKPNSHF